ncbi:hypothetical protein [Azospirillum sp. SYSU D00513]|uniref:hypothetical protein n=1 Tax=Azospirillum sp. SYSU D00513 TaxID=2812561 RepID=UPI001FFEEADA|nr:hypothetical protein [Azospirillum sp. SYSU D00513]
MARSITGPAGARGAGEGTARGVVTGNYFNFNPLPPQPDLLGKPLVVPDLPAHKRPKENWRGRFQRLLVGLRLGRQSAGTRLRWKMQDTLASVVASVSAAAQRPNRRAPAARGGGTVPVVTVRHPYHLRHVFDMLPQIPDEVAAERRFLELVLMRILRRYGEQVGLMRGGAFSFEAEAKEYLLAGFRMERQIKQFTNPDERFAALQAIHTAYFHGRNYYYYALLRREKLNPENKLFMLFSRACYFNARIDWNGELLEKPSPRSLPDRDTMMFYIQRDRTVLTRYREDPDFQRQIKAILRAFPE